ncbi:MAG: twin-arginine translocase subunit TatC [Bacteroidota bacterium]|nr:twin-arginine translocase subunit TatC [Bacteroidota bacterium]
MKKKDDKEMTFWDHLDELRGVIIHSFVAFAVCMILAFYFKKILFDHIILAPKEPDFITYRVICKIGKMLSMPSFCPDVSTFHLININLAGQFMSHITISAVAGLIIASPYIIWKFWRFVKPGLTEKERKSTRGAAMVITLLFLTGILFSYFVVVPLMVNFLGGYQVSEMVSNQIALTSYTGIVTSMTLIMGLIFEFPVVVLFLTKIGILSPKKLRKFRKHTIVIILIVAGIITPSPDVVSQLIVAFPLYALYEISLVISSRIYAQQILEAEKEEEEEQEEEATRQPAG